MPEKKRDFFISFNKADRKWAEWIAWQLENASYTVYYQHWDFEPGSNFVLKMDDASRMSRSTVLVLSESFLKSGFTKAEWTTAFAEDPTGSKRKILPILVGECKPEGLLGTRVYTNLLGLTQQQATDTLLAAVRPGRKKPPQPAPFPGSPAPQYPPSQSQPEPREDPVLWLYLSTPSDLPQSDQGKIVEAAKAAGLANIIRPGDSSSLERADAAIFVVSRKPQPEAWRSRLRSDLETARQKKIPHRLYLDSAVSSTEALLPPDALSGDTEVCSYSNPKSLAGSIQADLSKAREGLKIAGDLDWYLNEEHRAVLMAMREGDYTRAHDLCSALLTRRPYSPRGRYNMACILSRQAHDARSWDRSKLLDAAQASLENAVSYGFIEFARRTALGPAESSETAVKHILADPDLQELFLFRPVLKHLLENPTSYFQRSSIDWSSHGGGGGPSGSGCIDAGMPVDLCGGGALPVSHLSTGQRIQSWDEANRSPQIGEVRAVREHRAEEMVIVNGFLRVTPLHPLLTPDGWKRAGRLKVGDQLIKSDGSCLSVSSITSETGQFTVFDLSVEPHKNLSVAGVIAHNDKF